MPGPLRSTTIVLFAASQLGIAGCAVRGQQTATKHDVVEVRFDPAESVTAGDRLYSVQRIVGDAWSVRTDSLRLRVREAESPDEQEISDLPGRVVTVSRDHVASILVLDRDHSGEFMASTVVVFVVASLLGLRWLIGQAAGG